MYFGEIIKDNKGNFKIKKIRDFNIFEDEINEDYHIFYDNEDVYCVVITDEMGHETINISPTLEYFKEFADETIVENLLNYNVYVDEDDIKYELYIIKNGEN